MCYGFSFHYLCGHITARFSQRCENRCRLPESDPFPLDFDCEQCVREMEIEDLIEQMLGDLSIVAYLVPYLDAVSRDPSLKTGKMESYIAKVVDAMTSIVQDAMGQSHIDGFELTRLKRDQKWRKFRRPPMLGGMDPLDH